MTEYDDTLIDMSDVDDKLDDETETSSSEIDERRPSTSESQAADHNSLANNCRSFPDSINSNSNPILVVSSKYYIRNARTEPQQEEEQAQESASSDSSRAALEETEKIEDSKNSASLSNSNVGPSLDSTFVNENTSPQLSSGEVSDTEEDNDDSFASPVGGELRDAENCSTAAEESLSESPEAVSDSETRQ
ncbi:hypothetical protein EGW08_011624, partial [Elysia chlorotica]